MPMAIIEVNDRLLLFEDEQVQMAVLIDVADALDGEAVFVQTHLCGNVCEIHFTVVEINARPALLHVVAAPMHDQVDEPIAVEVRGMNVDFISHLRDVEMAACAETAFPVAELEDHAWPLVQ